MVALVALVAHHLLASLICFPHTIVALHLQPGSSKHLTPTTDHVGKRYYVGVLQLASGEDRTGFGTGLPPASPFSLIIRQLFGGENVMGSRRSSIGGKIHRRCKELFNAKPDITVRCSSRLR